MFHIGAQRRHILGEPPPASVTAFEIEDGARAVVPRHHDGRALDEQARRFQTQVELGVTRVSLERLGLHHRDPAPTPAAEDVSEQLVEALIRLLAGVAVLPEAVPEIAGFAEVHRIPHVIDLELINTVIKLGFATAMAPPVTRS